MALFSRRKRREAAQESPEQADTERDDAGPDDTETADTDTTDTDTADTETEEREPGQTAEPAASSASDEATADRPEHLAEGPYDEAEAPEEDRIDLGGVQVPTIDGMELRMEVDQRSGSVTGANLVIAGSSLQVQAFAAPKSRGLWDEVRSSLRDSVVKQGGTAETRPGPFGTELITRLPVKRADGRTGYRPARFIGVDGPRWFPRAILTGKALGDKEQSRPIETLGSRLVVVRGGEAMAPQELIGLHLPGQRAGLIPQKDAPIDPLERGPEITEVG